MRRYKLSLTLSLFFFFFFHTHSLSLSLSLTPSLRFFVSVFFFVTISVSRSLRKQWDGGKGSHHPDYDPSATGDDVVKASRESEEMLNAIIKNDIKLVYKKIEEGADVNFVFGRAYSCNEGKCNDNMVMHQSNPSTQSLFLRLLATY